MRSRLRLCQRNYNSLPWPWQMALGLVAVFPAVICWTLAFGDHHRGLIHALVVPIALAIVFIAQSMWRSHRTRLSRVQRVTLEDTLRTGKPSGDPTVDALALDRLQQAGTAPPWVSRAFGGVIALILIVPPVLAALRASPWWLATYVSLPVFAVVTPVHAFDGRARDRLRTMQEAAHSPQPPRDAGTAPPAKRRD